MDTWTWFFTDSIYSRAGSNTVFSCPVLAPFIVKSSPLRFHAGKRVHDLLDFDERLQEPTGKMSPEAVARFFLP